MRSKADEVSQAGTGSWTDRADWTNNFGAPIENKRKTSAKTLFGLAPTAAPKHKLSRFQDSGLAFVTVPELLVDDFCNAPQTPVNALERITVTQDVHQKVDTSSLNEA